MLSFSSRFLCLAAILTLFGAEETFGQYNVIQIVADDMGWTDLSGGSTILGNGSPYYETPNLDALAAGGLSFTSAYVQPTCSPTRAAIFTGQYAPRNGIYSVGALNGVGDDTLLVVPTNGGEIKSESITIGETLQAAGYHTCHIGKFHCTAFPEDITNQHGFTQNIGGTSSGGPNGNVPYFAQLNNRGDWVFASAHGPEFDAYAEPYTQQYIDENLVPFANGNDPNTLVGTPKHLSDAMADAAVDYLADRLNDGSPFFVNVAFNAIHVEVNARPDLEAKYQSLPPSTIPAHDSPAYAGLLEGMDQAIGRIVSFVQDSGLEDNTLILFVSDNGGTNVTDSVPLSGSKGNFLEGGIRVPMMAYMPSQIASGSTTNVATHVVDLYKTYAELAGANLPDPAVHPLDGESLVDVMFGLESELDRDTIFYHFPGYSQLTTPKTMAIHDGPDGNRYKLSYFYETRSYEFYDLSNDIGESNDLVAAGMTSDQFVAATSASSAMIQWLQDQAPQSLTSRATSEPVPPPHHSPWLVFGLGATEMGGALGGEVERELAVQGLTMNLEASGESAVFASTDSGLGIQSSLDSGNQIIRRRINGSLSTPEGIVVSFDQDVFPKGLSFRAFSGLNAETINLQFESGENPFAFTKGYDSDGFSVANDTLSYTHDGTVANAFDLLLGQLAQSEILLKAGTTLRISANPATDGGVLLSRIAIALPQSVEVNPGSAQVTRGVLASGSVLELLESDNQDLVGQRSNSDLQSRIELEIQSASPIRYPSSLNLTLESAVFARSAIAQTVELFDFEAGIWLAIDTRAASRFSDSTVVVSASGDLSRFVAPTTGEIKARVRYESQNPRQKFSANVDQFVWEIN